MKKLLVLLSISAGVLGATNAFADSTIKVSSLNSFVVPNGPYEALPDVICQQGNGSPTQIKSGEITKSFTFHKNGGQGSCHTVGSADNLIEFHDSVTDGKEYIAVKQGLAKQSQPSYVSTVQCKPDYNDKSVYQAFNLGAWYPEVRCNANDSIIFMFESLKSAK